MTAYHRFSDLLGVGGVPSTKRAAKAWFIRRGVPLETVNGRGGKAFVIRVEHLPLQVRTSLQPLQRATAEPLNLEGARERYLTATPKARGSADTYAAYVTRMVAEIAATGETPSAAARRLAPVLGVSEKTLREKHRIAAAASQEARAWLLLPDWKPNKARWTAEEEAFWDRVVWHMTGTKGGFPLRQAIRRAGKDAVAEGLPTVVVRRIEHRWRQLGATERTAILCGEAERDRRHMPSQRRARPPYAMHTINIDARQTRVWCRFEDGSEGRAWEVVAQDVHSSKVLSVVVARSENSDAIRSLILRVVAEYGIPQNILLDNGSANATFGLGSCRDRDMSEPEFDLEARKRLLHRLNINVYFARPQNGREKPIERVFRDRKRLDWGRDIHDRGAFDGRDDMTKPRPRNGFIPIEEFRALSAETYRDFNGEAGRRGVGMNGRSADQAFADGLALRAQHGVAPPPRLSPDQFDVARRVAHDVTPTKDRAEVVMHDGKLVFQSRNHALRDAILSAARRSPTGKIIALVDPDAPEKGAILEDHDGRRIGVLPVAARREFVSDAHEARAKNAEQRAKRAAQKAEKKAQEARRTRWAPPAPSTVPETPAPHPAGPVIAPAFGVKPQRDTAWEDLIELGLVSDDDVNETKRASGGRR